MGLDFEAQRIKMVDGQLRTTDVTDHAILAAFLAIPRENFVPEAKIELSYLDSDIEIVPGRYLPEPSPFAKLVSLAEITRDDSVLEIGCGTGYTSAILSRLAGQVTALECDAGLAELARSNLVALEAGNVTVVPGDLSNAAAAPGSFDVILISGSVGVVSAALFGKLKEGGRLACVENEGRVGVARLYIKRGGAVSGRFAFNANMKPLPGFEKPVEFAF